MRHSSCRIGWTTRSSIWLHRTWLRQYLLATIPLVFNSFMTGYSFGHWAMSTYGSLCAEALRGLTFVVFALCGLLYVDMFVSTAHRHRRGEPPMPPHIREMVEEIHRKDILDDLS